MRAIILGGVIVIGLVAPLFGMVFEKPTKGQNIVVGKPFDVWIRPEPGESCERIETGGMPAIPLNRVTGRFEGQVTLERKHPLGKTNFFAPGEPSTECRDAEIIINVVLPATTTVQSIDVDPKETILKIARKPNGELVQITRRGKKEIGVGGTYSDGVERGIDDTIGTTYESRDEKVAIVISPQDLGNGKTSRPLIKATGPGKTEIIVRHGPYESRVTVYVDACPYIEGQTDKQGCPF